MDIQVGSQVEWRRPMRNVTLVEIGNVVSINAQDQTAKVDFPTLYKMKDIPLVELKNTLSSFNGVRVQESPARRTLARAINQ